MKRLGQQFEPVTLYRKFLDEILRHNGGGRLSGKQQKLTVGVELLELQGQIKAVQAGHQNVAQQDVGDKLTGNGQGLISGIAAANIKSRRSENLSGAIRNGVLVINNQDPRRGGHFGAAPSRLEATQAA